MTSAPCVRRTTARDSSTRDRVIFPYFPFIFPRYIRDFSRTDLPSSSSGYLCFPFYTIPPPSSLNTTTVTFTSAAATVSFTTTVDNTSPDTTLPLNHDVFGADSYATPNHRNRGAQPDTPCIHSSPTNTLLKAPSSTRTTGELHLRQLDSKSIVRTSMFFHAYEILLTFRIAFDHHHYSNTGHLTIPRSPHPALHVLTPYTSLLFSCFHIVPIDTSKLGPKNMGPSSPFAKDSIPSLS